MVRISRRYATRACKQFEFTMSRIRLEALNGAFQGGGLSRVYRGVYRVFIY